MVLFLKLHTEKHLHINYMIVHTLHCAIKLYYSCDDIHIYTTNVHMYIHSTSTVVSFLQLDYHLPFREN